MDTTFKITVHAALRASTHLMLIIVTRPTLFVPFRSPPAVYRVLFIEMLPQLRSLASIVSPEFRTLGYVEAPLALDVLLPRAAKGH